MLMATGKTCQITAKFGFPIKIQDGRLTATARGNGNLTTDGRGFHTSHGDGRHSTMDAGSFGAAIGFGGRDRSESMVGGATILFGRRLMFPSLAGVPDLDSDSVLATLGGFRVALETSITRGGATEFRESTSLVMCASTIMMGGITTVAASLLPCIAGGTASPTLEDSKMTPAFEPECRLSGATNSATVADTSSAD